MNIAIIDDEVDARQSLRFYINKYLPSFNIIAEAESVASGKKVLENDSIDVVFLDISMRDGSGFDLLNAFPDRTFKVIFVTGHDEYAIKAFRYSALDYILKPIDGDDFSLVSQKLQALSPSDPQNDQLDLLEDQLNQKNFSKIAIPHMDGTVFIDIINIVHLESDGNYTTITTQNEKSVLAVKLLKEYEELLPDDMFFRTHKSHIVNLNSIEAYRKEDERLILISGQEIPVARRRKKALLDRIG